MEEKDFSREVEILLNMMDHAVVELFPDPIERIGAQVFITQLQLHITVNMRIGLKDKRYIELLRILANLFEASDDVHKRMKND